MNIENIIIWTMRILGPLSVILIVYALVNIFRNSDEVRT